MAIESGIDPRIFQNPPVYTKAADHKTIYSNVARTAVSPFDIRIVFGQVSDPVPDSPAQHTAELATVIMAAEQAKALIPIMLQAIQQYEALYGEIRDISARLTKMKEEALAKASTPGATEAASKTGMQRNSKRN